jgi:hypothetical protein
LLDAVSLEIKKASSTADSKADPTACLWAEQTVVQKVDLMVVPKASSTADSKAVLKVSM